MVVDEEEEEGEFLMMLRGSQELFLESFLMLAGWPAYTHTGVVHIHLLTYTRKQRHRHHQTGRVQCTHYYCILLYLGAKACEATREN